MRGAASKKRTSKERVEVVAGVKLRRSWRHYTGLVLIAPREEDMRERFQNMWTRCHSKGRTKPYIPERSTGGGPRPEYLQPVRYTVVRPTSPQTMSSMSDSLGRVGLFHPTNHCGDLGFEWKRNMPYCEGKGPAELGRCGQLTSQLESRRKGRRRRRRRCHFCMMSYLYSSKREALATRCHQGQGYVSLIDFGSLSVRAKPGECATVLTAIGIRAQVTILSCSTFTDSGASFLKAERTTVYFQSDRESSVTAWVGAITKESLGPAVEEHQQERQQARVQPKEDFKLCRH